MRDGQLTCDAAADAPTREARRAFWRYWGSSSSSQLGDAVTEVAMPLIALGALDAGALEVGLVTAAGYAAWLLIGLPAGVFVSRLPLRGTQVTLDVVRAAALATVPAAYVAGVLTVAQLAVVAFVVSVCSVVFSVANMSFVPKVVPADQLESRNSILSATYAGTLLAGPPLAGALIQLAGAAAALLLDVVSYLVSAFMLTGLPKVPTDAVEHVERRGMRSQIGEGWRYLTRHPVMGPCLVDSAVVNFTSAGMIALAPVYLVHTLHSSAAEVGLVLGASSAGSLVAALLAPRILTWFGSARASIGCGLVATAAAFAVAAASGPVAVIGFAVGYGIWQGAISVRGVAYVTYRQAQTPPELLPRVIATARFVSWGVMPFGALTAGTVAAAASPRAALWLLAVVTVTGPLFLLTTGIRTCRSLDDHEPQNSARLPTRPELATDDHFAAPS